MLYVYYVNWCPANGRFTDPLRVDRPDETAKARSRDHRTKGATRAENKCLLLFCDYSSSNLQKKDIEENIGDSEVLLDALAVALIGLVKRCKMQGEKIDKWVKVVTRIEFF